MTLPETFPSSQLFPSQAASAMMTPSTGSIDGGAARSGLSARRASLHLALVLAVVAAGGGLLGGAPMAQSAVLGVLYAESAATSRFGYDEEDALAVLAEHVAAIAARLQAREDGPTEPLRVAGKVAAPVGAPVRIRRFGENDSIFVGEDYLIKGVAGRILWSLLSQYVATGRTEFTNRELRLDPTLELPGFKDNLESRLLLLKRRLDERHAPVRIEKTARGRFRIEVAAQLHLEPAA